MFPVSTNNIKSSKFLHKMWNDLEITLISIEYGQCENCLFIYEIVRLVPVCILFFLIDFISGTYYA